MRKLLLSRGSDRGSGGGRVFCRAQVSFVARSASVSCHAQISLVEWQRKCLSRCASQSCRVADVPLAARKLVLSRGRCVSCRVHVSRAGQVSLVLHKLVLSRGSGRASCPVQVSLFARQRCLSLVVRKLFLARGSDRGSGGGRVSCRAQVSLVARQRKCLSRCASQSCRVFDVPLAARKLVLSRGRCVSCRARVSRAGQVSLVLHKLVLSRGSGRASCPVQVSLVARHRCLLSCASYSCRAAATAAAADEVSLAARS